MGLKSEVHFIQDAGGHRHEADGGRAGEAGGPQREDEAGRGGHAQAQDDLQHPLTEEGCLDKVLAKSHFLSLAEWR